MLYYLEVPLIDVVIAACRITEVLLFTAAVLSAILFPSNSFVFSFESRLPQGKGGGQSTFSLGCWAEAVTVSQCASCFILMPEPLHHSPYRTVQSNGVFEFIGNQWSSCSRGPKPRQQTNICMQKLPCLCQVPAALQIGALHIDIADYMEAHVLCDIDA